MLSMKELSKKMTDDILKALRKENCPEKIIIEAYIEKQLEKIVNNFSEKS